ncbi:MAG: glycosyltransferase family 4 protein [Bacillota bacterium]
MANRLNPTALRVAVDARPMRKAHGTGIGTYTGQLVRALAREESLRLQLVWDPAEPRPFLRRATFLELGWDETLEQTLLPRWLAENGAQVYHLPQNGLGRPRNSPVPLVITLHDVIPFRLPEMVRPSYLKKFLVEVPEAVAAARRVITVSEAARADICAVLDLPPEKVAVLPVRPGVIFRPRDPYRARRILVRRYGLDGRFILYGGGYNPRKNVASLLWAFARILRFLPVRQRLILLGAKGPATERLAALAAALEIEREVVFPGFIPRRHLPLFYTAADLFCYPSLYEGFGLPPLEAMACGTPVVASAIPSHREVLGEAAVLVPPEDVAALARAMLDLLTDSARANEYARRGLARVAAIRAEPFIPRLLRIYEEAAGS